VATTGGDGAMGDLRSVDSPDSRLHLPELSAAQVGRAVEHSSVAVIITDVDGRIEYVNQCFSQTTGYRLEEIVGKTPSILKSGQTLAGDYRELWCTIRRGDDWRGEFCNRRKDGTLYWSSATISPVEGPSGANTHFVAIQVDIGERKRVEQELRHSEQRFRSLVETSVLGICIEQDDKPLFINQSFAEIHGYDNPAEIIQLGSLEALYVQDDLARVFQSRRKRARGRTPFHHEIRGVKKDGSIIWLQTQTMAVSWNGEPAAQTTVIDVTARKSREDRLHRQANYDPLTDLPSRKLALDRLGSAIANARRRRNRVATLFIDVDRFKSINDALGHAAGDWLLRQLADRIRSSIREEDTLARLGGDEFVVILPEVRQHADAEAVAGKILGALARPFIIDGQETFVTVSIGVAVFPDLGDDAEALIRHADTAMYVAKESGRGSVHVFTDELGERKRKRTRLEAGLRNALERDELTLCYQPLIDIRSGRIVGAEALLRWFNPEYGQISPRHFVRLAEHTGLIVPIGMYSA
jgi:diguanylate cyclase (GGDEF)-like protein/PAS domain S-box-containing protein